MAATLVGVLVAWSAQRATGAVMVVAATQPASLAERAVGRPAANFSATNPLNDSPLILCGDCVVGRIHQSTWEVIADRSTTSYK